MGAHEIVCLPAIEEWTVEIFERVAPLIRINSIGHEMSFVSL